MYRVQSGWTVFKRILRFIFRKPLLLIPMLLAWGVYVYVAFLVQTNVDIDSMELGALLALLFGFTFLSTFTIGISSLFILELLEQHETTGKMNPFKAIFDMLTKDLWRALPIIIVWAIVDFVLMIVIALLDSTRKRKNRPKRPKGPIQRAVEAFRDLVRMGSMTVFTVIAWEDLGPKASFDKGFDVFKRQFAEMLTGFGLGKIIGLLLFIPIVLVYFGLESGILPTQETTIGLIIYISIVWSLKKLIEQLYVSELYLWYMHYENAIQDAKNTGKTPPASMYDVPKPSFTDRNFDLAKNSTDVGFKTYSKEKRDLDNKGAEEDPFAKYDK